jgi:hypothetical protein
VKPPGPGGTARIDVSREELEALLEGVRPALGEVGYQKLHVSFRQSCVGLSRWVNRRRQMGPGLFLREIGE